jgi:alpha-L-fucosidase
LKSFLPGEIVKDVRLLGAGKVPFALSFGVLTVKLPDTLPTKYVNCLAITI